MRNPIIDAYREALELVIGPSGTHPVAHVEIGGVSMRAFRKAPHNLTAIFDQAEADFADRIYLEDENGAWSYQRMFDGSRRLAGRLVDRFGIKPGDRVGLAMRNRAEWIVAFMAILRAGGVAVLFNSRSSEAELRTAITTVPCDVVIADSVRAPFFPSAKVVVLEVEDPAARELLETGTLLETLTVDHDAPAMILFTSGTTGRAKGAIMTHRNIGNMTQVLTLLFEVGIQMASRQAKLAPEVLRSMVPPSTSLLVFPLFHISGITSLFSTMMNGGKIIMLRRWDPVVALDLIEAKRISNVVGPPLVVHDLLGQPDAAARLATVAHMGVGGQATPTNLVARIAEALPKASQGGGWGMTELSGAAASASGAMFFARPAAAGIELPIAEIEARDDEGNTLPSGQAGELWVRSVLATPGYWNDEAATRAAYDDRRFFRTGDVGFIDEDRYVHIVDRKRDMVITSGENIYCAEVERALSSHPDILEVAVFGIPDERRGELAIAALRLRDGVDRTEAEVKSFARTHLADYKVPAQVIFDGEPLPRNSLGKVDKIALRQRHFTAAS